MDKVLKKIPKFKNEAEERNFWNKADSTDYIDWSKAKSWSFPNLKPSSKTINIRLPENLLNELKIRANKLDVPYQSYLKMIIAKDVTESGSIKTLKSSQV